MKKLAAVLSLFAVSAFAVDVETIVDGNFSTPASVRSSFLKVDRNTAALKTAVEAVTTADAAVKVTADAAAAKLALGVTKTSTFATGVTTAYATNIYTFLDADTNAVSFTNIVPSVTATTGEIKFASGVVTNSP